MKLVILMSVLVVIATAARIPKYRRLYVNPFNGQWNGWGSMGSGGAGQWPTNGGGDMTGTSDYGGGWMPSGGGDYGGMPGGDYGGGWNPGDGDYGGMPGGGGDYGGGWNPGGGDYGGMPGGGGGGGGGWFPPMETTTTPEPTTTIPPTCDSLKGSCVNSETECESKVIGSGQCEGSSLCCLPPVLPDVCGVTSVQKIVGGAESSAHAWPWQVSLQTSSDFHFCGGSLINNQWVVTAAHCVEESETYQIMLGEHDRNEDHGPEVKRTTIKVIKHEEYHGEAPYPNDIALLKLNEPVEFNGQISPACVPEPGEIFTNDTECWISGWGDTKDTGDMTKLQEMRIDVVDNQLCGEKWGQGYIKNTNICVGNGDIGACNGDSGGPLSCKSDSNKWLLAGATSWGISGCQTKGYPNVYTRVSEYRNWIIERILAN